MSASGKYLISNVTERKVTIQCIEGEYKSKEFKVGIEWLADKIVSGRSIDSHKNFFRLPEEIFSEYYMMRDIRDIVDKPKGNSIFVVWQKDGQIIENSLQLRCIKGNYQGKYFILGRPLFFSNLKKFNKVLEISDSTVEYSLLHDGFGKRERYIVLEEIDKKYSTKNKPWWKFW